MLRQLPTAHGVCRDPQTSGSHVITSSRPSQAIPNARCELLSPAFNQPTMQCFCIPVSKETDSLWYKLCDGNNEKKAHVPCKISGDPQTPLKFWVFHLLPANVENDSMPAVHIERSMVIVVILCVFIVFYRCRSEMTTVI